MVTNIAAYLFAPLDGLVARRESLRAQCRAWGLKGTILLSPEGINLFVAGAREDVDRLVALLRTWPGCAGLAPKYSESEAQPFSRMLVRLKKEIIAFGVDGIRPGERTSPKLAASTLKQWLDEGRPLTLLDTRNRYEVKLGTFHGATPLPIDHFRQFPEAVRALPPGMKEQPIVMFCTGGIRCEKAGPFMEREGFRHIWQLDGGILKYFEECGSAHYDGECFVFDQRVGVDPTLHETPSALCFACQMPLTEEDQADPRYVPNVSCPACYRTAEQQREELLARRHAALHEVTHPLPGSVPYDNRRPFSIPAELDGRGLLNAVASLFPHIPREDWQAKCDAGLLLDPEGRPAGADREVRTGERYAVSQPGNTEPDVAVDVRVLFEDDAIVVLHKPAPLPMHPGGRFNRNTLQCFLRHVYAPQRVRPAHRLDANTSGLVVCARTQKHARPLQAQFEAGTVEKTYLVRAQGVPAEETFECRAPIGVEPGPVGVRVVDEANGLAACTEFRVRLRRADGTTVLEARPLTGRTNQIRAHLWHLGMPVCGDPAYLPDGKLGETQTLPVDAPPLCLHAWRLAFDHPVTGERMTFEDVADSRFTNERPMAPSPGQ